MPRSLLAFLLLAACNGTLKGPCPGGTFNDADRDGFGVEEAGSCEYAADNSDDCDDLHASAKPAAAEVVDGLDNDCDGLVDEQDGDGVTTDADEDGSPAEEDCDDHDNDIHPGAPESCDGVDNNCDNTIDEGVTTTFYADADQDSFGDPATSADACVAPAGYTSDQSDCDDSNNAISPLLSETCDGIDNNCNGQIDEGVLQTFYVDADGDGYPGTAQTGCDAGANAATSTDVDDTDATVWPGAPEIADGKDNDGDGEVDEDISATDDDGDGYSEAGGDCDDTSAAYNPGTPEICDGYDNNCDGQIDEGLLITFYADADGDGYGDASRSINACSLPAGYAANSVDPDDTNAGITPTTDADGDGYPAGTDCDDSTSSTYPGAWEKCNGVDDDCDGYTDQGYTYHFVFADTDGDGYGDPSVNRNTCETLAGYVDDNTDCDDTQVIVHPNVQESCNGTDDDCDSLIDEVEDLDPSQTIGGYVDADGDGEGTGSRPTAVCTTTAGYASTNTDCDDDDAWVYTGATEYCDGVDNDCNTQIDESGGVGLVETSGRRSDWTVDFTGTTGSPATPSLTTDGDLHICAGTWYVQISVSADVNLIGEDESTTILDGDGTGQVVSIATFSDVEISDLTIQNGYTTSNGGGIYADTTTTLSLERVTVADNSADGSGGGIYGAGSSYLTIEGSQISNNFATNGNGGGLVCTGCNAIIISNSTFDANRASSAGGGMHLQSGEIGSSFSLTSSSVSSNTAAYGGGVYVDSFKAVAFDNAIFMQNAATIDGGGIYLFDNYLDGWDSVLKATCQDSAGSPDREFNGNSAGANGSDVLLHVTSSAQTFESSGCEYVNADLHVVLNTNSIGSYSVSDPFVCDYTGCN